MARENNAEFLYAGARIRAMEAGLVGKERLAALLELKTTEEILTSLTASGFLPEAGEGADAEERLLSALSRGFGTVTEATGEPRIAATLQLVYDCSNVKSLIKCAVRGVDPAPMLCDAGTVPAAKLAEKLAAGDAEGLPRHMAEAIPEAKEAYAKTGNPQEFDLILDAACFADMKEAAEPFAFLREYVARRADLVNFMICLRLLRGERSPLTRAFLERATVPGGSLPASFFREAYDGVEARLAEMAELTPYAALFHTDGEKTLAAAEKRADDVLTEYVRGARFTPFGAAVPFGYLYGLELAVKNVRILLASREAGLDTETVRGRLRESYV